MAVYHLECKTISRINKQTGKPRSIIACAAYRSGNYMYDQQLEKEFYYKRSVEPEVYMLTPKNAPDWAKSRIVFWNNVNQYEKNCNARLAREIILALPIELKDKEQTEMLLNYCQKTFVDDGMVADVCIHRDKKDNPHSHILLSVRPFNEDGSWGNKAKKEYKYDENGNHIYDKNGKKAFYKKVLTNWDDTETLQKWRSQWSDQVNLYLEKNLISERVSHLSNRARGLDEIPTIHEGFVARKIEKRGGKSDLCEKNREIKKYNNELKKSKDQIGHIQKDKNFSQAEWTQISYLAKKLKMYIDIDSVTNRKKGLDRWEMSLLIKSDTPENLNKIELIKNQKEYLKKAEKILNDECDRFLDKYYPNFGFENYLEKHAVVKQTIINNKVYTDEEIFDKLLPSIYEQEDQSNMNSLLKNIVAYNMIIDYEINKKAQINEFDEEYNQIKGFKEQLNYIQNLQLKKLDPDLDISKLTFLDKELILTASEYYEKYVPFKDIKTFNTKDRYNLDQQKEILSILNNKDNFKETIQQKYPSFNLKNPLYVKMFIEECRKSFNDFSKEEKMVIMDFSKVNNILEICGKDIKTNFKHSFKENPLKESFYESSFKHNNNYSFALTTVLNSFLDPRQKTRKKEKTFSKNQMKKSKKKNLMQQGLDLDR